ncbi:MAG: hypothetical protein ACOYN0_16590 [Phycisphaerales bacterium]
MPQRTTGKPAGVVIGAEREIDRGWAYDVSIRWPDGNASDHEVTLSWADHNHWCGGASPPSRVAEAVVRLATSRGSLPVEFDCATVRRWCPGLDAQLRETM